ncbi:MAG: hypothetical protein M1608_16540, partial [Candidatus Omnitrophica bacterium]|nr:hypothetical protein [Candidatus Omnitrophota bacterium]
VKWRIWNFVLHFVACFPSGVRDEVGDKVNTELHVELARKMFGNWKWPNIFYKSGHPEYEPTIHEPI